ncbi:MAG: hypothetical protein EBQ78_09330 [Betaproteobacteria bacterium]|jgi:hypothetical protein|nr:hypothetical protein [Betaproteobacteria bacterium]NBT79280.1 hypothetical protein [Betaproteobacteria bacterium]NBY17783.1 hypothetical protein [Betaproteobacteria bacterium]
MSEKPQPADQTFEDEVLSSIEEELPELVKMVVVGMDRDGDVIVLGFDRKDEDGLLDEIGVFRLLGQGITGMSDIIEQDDAEPTEGE